MNSKKEKQMGRKGVSKRKPKKSIPSSNTNKGRSGDGSLVQSLVQEKGAPLNRDGMNTSTGSNKSQKKR
jgi:hypothetical protein